MKNEKSYLGRNPEHARWAIAAVLTNARAIGEETAYQICSEILSDICGDSISVHTKEEVWGTYWELSDEGWF